MNKPQLPNIPSFGLLSNPYDERQVENFAESLYDRYLKGADYRLINRLCYGNVTEETLLREIKNQETDVKTDTIVNNFDNIIMRLLFDYLFWLLKENEEE